MYLYKGDINIINHILNPKDVIDLLLFELNHDQAIDRYLARKIIIKDIYGNYHMTFYGVWSMFLSTKINCSKTSQGN